MIIKKEIIDSIPTFTVGKDMTDEQLLLKEGISCTPAMEKKIHIFHDSVDVITDTGEILIRFRKKVLTDSALESFFDSVIHFAKKPTMNRGQASGKLKKKKHDIKTNNRVMSNIIGYMDKFSVGQYYGFNNIGMKIIKPEIRPTMFTHDFPEKWKQTIPLIQEIDAQYKKLAPLEYAKQRKKADETYFVIPETAFTTVTMNLNFQTHLHADKGDDEEGLGNLTVIEKGKVKGGAICFLQYGVGVQMCKNSLCIMNVHKHHFNTKIEVGEEGKRLSIVCYLRKKIWEQTRDMSKKEFLQHNAKLEEFYAKIKANKGNYVPFKSLLARRTRKKGHLPFKSLLARRTRKYKKT